MTCQFCDKYKKGLHIMPLRYAVGRTDMDAEILDLPDTFKSAVADIPLPEKSAKYTARLLRPGHLYVFNEVRGEWKAYYATPKGYLYELPKLTEPPANVEDIQFKCEENAAERHIARCITIPDAKHAGRVWFAFSDTIWTERTLEQHRWQAHREKHMTCVNVQDWVNGNQQQPQAAPLSDLTSVVNEASRDGRDLSIKEAAKNEDGSFGVLNSKSSIAEWYMPQNEQTQSVKVSKKRDTLVQLAAVSVVAYPGFEFSSHKFYGFQEQAKEILAWGDASEHAPMLVTVADPVGVSMELNLLAITQAAEWTQDSKRKQPYETAMTIEAVKMAVSNGAVQEQRQENYQTALAGQALMNIVSPTARRYLTRPDWEERVRYLSPEEQAQIATENWPRYEECYDESARQKVIKEYNSALTTFDTSTIKPLDECYVSWLKSKAFKNSFACNFDSQDKESGKRYLLTLYACINDATGRSGPKDWFKQCLEGNAADQSNVILRGLMLNNDELVEKFEDAINKVDDKDHPIRAAGLNVKSLWEEVFSDASIASIENIAGALAITLSQLGWPIIDKLNDFVDKGMVWTAAKLPEKRMLALMSGAMRVKNPNLELAAVEFEGARGQVTRALAKSVAEVSGGRGSLIQSGAREIYDRNSPVFRGKALIVVDADDFDYLRKLSGAMGSEERAAGIAQRVRVEDFERMYASSVRRVADVEVKGGIVGALFGALAVSSAFKQLAEAEAKGEGIQITRWNVRSAMSTLVGGVVETIGKVSKAFRWGRFVLGSGSAIGRTLTVSRLLVGTGRWLGAIGGVIAGVLAIYDGAQQLKTQPVLGVSLIVLGGVAAMAAFVVLLSASLAGVGIIVGIIAAAAIWVISLFKDNDIQKWLKQTMYFGKAEDFDSFAEQSRRLSEIIGG